MKTIPLLLALIGLTALGPVACNTTSPGGGGGVANVLVSPFAVQAAASLATSSALGFNIKNSAERKMVAADCEAASAAIRSMTAGTPPTVAQFRATIHQFGGNDVPLPYEILAGSLSSLYASFYPSIQANPDVAKITAYLEALASGVEAGSAPYL